MNHFTVNEWRNRAQSSVGVYLNVTPLEGFEGIKHQPNPWKPADWYEFDSFGSLRTASTPAAREKIEAKANAGMFPPP